MWGASLRVRRETARRRAAVLAEAGELLTASVGYEATLRTVAHLVVPGLADWCAVDVPEPGGRIRNIATAHADPAKVRMAQALRRRYPLSWDEPAGVPKVLRTVARSSTRRSPTRCSPPGRKIRSTSSSCAASA
jgi:hypothetical protein